MTASSTRLLRALTFLAALHLATAVVTVRSIPSTPDNQDFFTLSQSLIQRGERKISSCGPQLPDIERCIRVCNSPGLAERSGCCCIARPNDFTIGLRGGCRYSQRVQNFTSRFIYKSSPVTAPNMFFGETSCARNVPSGTGAPCTCSIQWEATTEDLADAIPIPTPSVSASPDLTASPSPVEPPVITPVPSELAETEQPPVDETVTPTPDSELIPSGPGPLPSSDPTETDTEPMPSIDPEPTETPTDEAGSTDEAGPTDEEDDAEEQASEDDDGTVCVDERYLEERGFQGDTLVHEEGLMAKVLCPHGRSLPCGTADHKVRYAGQDMSYESMCSLPHVQCRLTRMKVNSVYSHLWTDVEHEDVTLTMFDARYAESAQKALHTVMRGWRTARMRVFA